MILELDKEELQRMKLVIEQLQAEYNRLEEVLAYQLTRLDLSKKVQQDTNYDKNDTGIYFLQYAHR